MTERGTTALDIPRTPKSFNAAGARDPRGFHKAKTEWEFELALLMRDPDKGLPGWPTGPQLQTVTASAVLTFAHKRKRDEGNFRVLLEKALGDALQGGKHWPDGKWIPDDTSEHYSFRGVVISPDLGAAQTLLTLEWTR